MGTESQALDFTSTMAHYLVGDVQGCDGPLARLLEKIGFSPSRDTLYLLGDLVKRIFGSPTNLVSGLLSNQKLTLSELGHIRQLVEQKESELRRQVRPN